MKMRARRLRWKFVYLNVRQDSYISGRKMHYCGVESEHPITYDTITIPAAICWK